MVPISKILLLLNGLLCFQDLTAQTLKGKLHNQEDSSAVMFANIQIFDSSQNILTVSKTNVNGEFEFEIPEKTSLVKIFSDVEHGEIHIINFKGHFIDTVEIGNIPMIQAPPHLQVQFYSISQRKERRNQEKIVRTYNKRVKQSDNFYFIRNREDLKMTATWEEQKDTNRLKLIYLIDFNALIKN